MNPADVILIKLGAVCYALSFIFLMLSMRLAEVVMMNRIRRLFPAPKKKMKCPFCGTRRLAFKSSDESPVMSQGRVLAVNVVRRYECSTCGAAHFSTRRK